MCTAVVLVTAQSPGLTSIIKLTGVQTCKLSSLHHNPLRLITYFWSDCSVIYHQRGCLPSVFYIIKEIQDRNKSEKRKKKKTDENIETDIIKCIKINVWRKLKHKHEQIKGDGSYCPFMGVGERSLRTNKIEMNF